MCEHAMNVLYEMVCICLFVVFSADTQNQTSDHKWYCLQAHILRVRTFWHVIAKVSHHDP